MPLFEFELAPVERVVPWGEPPAQETFLSECRSFAARLLRAMEDRLAAIAGGEARPRIAVDVGSLREQHAAWERELEGYFESYAPEIEWCEAESALRAIATEGGIRPPVSG